MFWSILFARPQGRLERAETIMHFRWKVIWTHRNQPNTLKMGQRVNTHFDIFYSVQEREIAESDHRSRHPAYRSFFFFFPDRKFMVIRSSSSVTAHPASHFPIATLWLNFGSEPAEVSQPLTQKSLLATLPYFTRDFRTEICKTKRLFARLPNILGWAPNIRHLSFKIE